MSTIYGTGREVDVTMKCGSGAKTTASQYLVGVVSDEFTFNPVSNTATAAKAVGVIQSYQSSGSEGCTVRLFGVTKVVCAGSVAAGSFVRAFAGISTTTHYGHVTAIVDGGTSTTYGATATSQHTVLGYALEAGQTNQAISIFLNPTLSDANILPSIGNA